MFERFAGLFRSKTQKQSDKDALKIHEQKSSNSNTKSTSNISLEMDNVSLNLKCTCLKDPTYKFACKEAMEWFVSDKLQMKINR